MYIYVLNVRQSITAWIVRQAITAWIVRQNCLNYVKLGNWATKDYFPFKSFQLFQALGTGYLNS